MTSSKDVHEAIDAWYESLSPLKVDLIGDFAGKELFVIHGDALMLHCIHKARVDLQDGFQLVHAVHAVESFLQKLKDRGCNFHIVWFRDQERLCLPGDTLPESLTSKHLLIRAIMIRHLQRSHAAIPDPSRGGSDAVCFEFASLDDQGFEQYLQENAVHFFLCLDAKTFGSLSRNSTTTHMSIVRELGVRGYSLAFINGLEFASSKVYCSVVSPSSYWKANPLLCPTSGEETPVFSFDPYLLNDVRGSIQDWTPWEDGNCLTSRELTAIYALCAMAKTNGPESREFCSWAAQYVVHLVLLRRLPLSRRSIEQIVGLPKNASRIKFVSDFSSYCRTALDLVPNNVVWDSFDLLDGRLLNCLESRHCPSLPKFLVLEAQEFAHRVKQITGVDISWNNPPPKQPELGFSAASAGTRENSVLPFSHPVLDNYLEDVHIKPTSVVERDHLPKIFKELTHWHNSRVSIDIKRPPRTKTKWELRSEQRFMATHLQYSASLTNATGKIIDPEIIVVVAEEPNQSPASSSKQPQPVKTTTMKGGKKAKAKSGKQLALEAAEAVRKGKAGAKADGALLLWKEERKSFDMEPDLVRRYSKVVKYLNGMSDHAKAAIEGEVALYACNTLANILAKVGRSTTMGMNIAALMWSTALRLNKSGNTVQFPDVPAGINFQLRYCGPVLERSFDPAPDPRVPFHPDAWQRRVLDAIDADKSLFVVAPTSAGKTFISFYAMKKVLKNSDDGVLVYVAPTKALVNQIAAEIQARFRKSFNRNAKSVWAIHTRDYRVNNPTGCQVLVTVPHILQIMLMAPSNAEAPNSWSRRVERVIFDEVHCIGQAEDGVIWEQLLLLAPCPIIALSATVGNPREFRTWLEGSEKAKGNELEMIVHSTRYSDLRKFLWEPQPREDLAFAGLQPVNRLPIPGLDDGSGTAGQFSYVHPMASIVNRARGTLQDISLEPRDCITLWESMAKHQTETHRLDPTLEPEKALRHVKGSDKPSYKYILRKADVAEYESQLKKSLETWMTDRTSPFEAVLKDLQSSYNMSEFDRRDLCKHALSLLTDLRAQGALPAILFNYDRTNCEMIAFGLLSQLSEAEDAWKASSPDWKKTIGKFEKYKKDSDKMKAIKEKEKKAKLKAKPRGDEGGDDDIREAHDSSAWEHFDPQAPLAMFSFADETKFAPSELEKTIASLKFGKINPKLIGALRRGVAVHHAGMNRKYRQVVEMLFRKGFLSVVVATGTLALGINMPCKTVVFYGDSVYLTSLNYHQAAGRAGRRGFDLLGNVVFAGMSQERCYEIMSSRLPDLRGHFPLSTTLILRTMSLLHHTRNSDFAVRAVQSLLSQTRLYLGGPADKMSIKHHVRFSIEYLRQQHLLGSDGTPLNFAGLVGHLYYTENAVFAFHSLLKEGYFHDLSAERKATMDAKLEKVVLVLAHIFCRIPVGNINRSWEQTIQRSPSVILLPPLPDAALRILRDHNRTTLDIFQNYAFAFVDQHLADRPDQNLPFTGLEVGVSKDNYGNEAVHRVLGDACRPPTKVRSPFAALSGFGDDSFNSIHELCSTTRSGVFLEESAIPFIPLFPDDTTSPWNAYLYHFYKHGDLEAIVRDNHIKRADVWFRLKDFSLVLATIVTSLRNFMDLTSGNDDMDMIDIQDADDAYQERLDEENAVDSGSLDNEDHPKAELPERLAMGTNSRKKAKKTVVADSWDDDISDDDNEKDFNLPGSSEGPGSSISDSAAGPAWDGDGEKRLPQVLKMFEMIQREFDHKLREVGA